jgi:hypothetical protein
MTAESDDSATPPPGEPTLWFEGDMLVMRSVGAVEVREMQRMIDMSEQLYEKYGYMLVLADAMRTSGLSSDARKLQAERLKRVIRPSHTAIYHVNAVVRVMTGLAQRGIEAISGKTYPVSFHKDEAEARAELDRQRVILQQSAAPPLPR